jgi:tetratricopeptide (TPR) repeat protein
MAQGGAHERDHAGDRARASLRRRHRVVARRVDRCLAQPANPVPPQGTVVTTDAAESARAAVAQALYAASATAAAEQRAADARLADQRRQIEALRSRLASGEGRDSAARTRVQALESELAQAQEHYVGALAQRDRAYAQEIAAFRKAVQDIVVTREGEAALRQYNAGDEVGALVVLDKLVDARERARQVRVNLETAAERRRVATLALDAKNKGKVQNAAVIARFEEVTRLDPGLHWDWVELARLHREAGQLALSRVAATKAAENASGDRDRAAALAELGDVLVAQGDQTAAKRRYEESLEIVKRLAAADPSSASLQRDLIVSHVKLHDVTAYAAHLEAALATATDMQRRGTLAPRDAWVVDDLKKRLGR